MTMKKTKMKTHGQRPVSLAAVAVAVLLLFVFLFVIDFVFGFVSDFGWPACVTALVSGLMLYPVRALRRVVKKVKMQRTSEKKKSILLRAELAGWVEWWWCEWVQLICFVRKLVFV